VKQLRSLNIIVFVLFFIVVLLPILFMFVGSFRADGRFSLDSYHELLLDHRQLGLLKNSLGLSMGTTCLSLVLGVPLAFFLLRSDLWGRKVFGALYLIPILIPPYIHAIVWAHLLSKNGWINQGLIRVFSLKEAPFNIYGLAGAIFVMTLAYFPFVTFMTITGLKSIDRRTEEASLLHHGALRTTTGVTLPLAAPHILCGALFVFIFSIINFGVPDILRLRVYPLEIFIQFAAYYNEKAAMALSLPLVALTFLVVLLQKWYMKDRPYVSLTGGLEQARCYHLGNLKPYAFIFASLLLLLSTATPIFTLLQIAGPLSNYIKVLETTKAQLGYSIIMAVLGGLTMLFLGFFMAYFIEKTTGVAKGIGEFASLIPFAIPATVLGIGMIKVWNQSFTDFIYGSSLMIILGYVAHFIPFTIRIIGSSLKQLNPRLEEVASLVTNKRFRVMGRIVIPLIRPGLAAGFFIGFVLSLGDLGTTLLIMPPGRSTVPVKIYNLMHYGADQMVAALCLLLIGLILAFSWVFYLCYKRLARVY